MGGFSLFFLENLFGWFLIMLDFSHTETRKDFYPILLWLIGGGWFGSFKPSLSMPFIGCLALRNRLALEIGSFDGDTMET